MWKVVAAVVALLVLACAGALVLGGYGGFEYFRLEKVEAEQEAVAARIEAADEAAGGRQAAACELGEVAYAARDFGRAITHLDECLEQAPGNAAALLMRGKSYAQLERYERAEIDIALAAEIDGTSVEAWRTLAWTRVRTGDDRGAIEAIDRWLALVPGAAEALHMRADCAYRLGSMQEALRDAARACDLGAQEGCALQERIRSAGRR
ncbi:MAG: tetratricopeptide repeat protein [Deltaproteobacteria bacterium]|nr:tetratricopeptide repeat protein [Deltaproteobacteria bacterium]